MNLLQKIHALFVSDKVNVWHYHEAKGKQFCYWLVASKERRDFDTLEEMVESAYGHIDPLKASLPLELPKPPLA